MSATNDDEYLAGKDEYETESLKVDQLTITKVMEFLRKSENYRNSAKNEWAVPSLIPSLNVGTQK